jgi:tetratricopeptide (TPR) repeat protein
MIRKILALFVTLSLLTFAAMALTDARPGHTDAAPGVLPLTTKSQEARRLVEEAWRLNLDQVQQAQAIEVLRAALKIDPDFAICHELLAQISLEPAEQIAEQEKAFATREHASVPEQLVIGWLQDAADHKLISAITKMNDVLGQYPHDKWVVFLSTWWLMTQTQYDRSIAVYENSGIKDSPGLNNNMGYVYAYMRQFDKAFALMDKYVAALPSDPNPQDSYAEILRLAGRYQQAIEHYRAALAIDPEFYSSQFGIADTYSLMGDQVSARREYEVGFQKFTIPVLHRIQWKTREATTWVREGDYEGADKAFQALADYAHANHMSQVEADNYRLMAMYQPDPKQALNLLDKADAALQEGKNSMQSALQQEAAQIWRVRVEVAVKTANKAMARDGVTRLAAMADSSSDKLIETAYEAAAGAADFSERKYKEAIPHLEEDPNNPLSLKLLAVAYEKTKDHAAAKKTIEILTSMNDPTLEQAVVVPAFRKCYQDLSCTGIEKSAYLKR